MEGGGGGSQIQGAAGLSQVWGPTGVDLSEPRTYSQERLGQRKNA